MTCSDFDLTRQQFERSPSVRVLIALTDYAMRRKARAAKLVMIKMLHNKIVSVNPCTRLIWRRPKRTAAPEKPLHNRYFAIS
jgi:hypothetical protein